jgi:hydroxymethylpyrimidine/phosphomethylpyrimidine kinase
LHQHRASDILQFMSIQMPKVLTIAGSDSGGCAGIQADLKTFAAFKTHGMSVVTAITAQNTRGVTAIQNVSPALIEAQIRAVLSDIGAAAVKSGMLPGAPAMRVVAACLREFDLSRYVLDPVMVATSGARLMLPGAEAALVRHLFPLALIVTPNRHEAEVLAGRRIRTLAQAKNAAQAIHELGPAFVLIKGGHFHGDAADLLFDGRNFEIYSAPREATAALHGAGCTLAAAIAACLARGMDIPTAVAESKRYVSGAIRHSYAVGKGPRPLGHFFRWWR